MMKFPSWLRTTLISVVSTIIVAGLGFGGWQYYQGVSFENAIKVMEDHIQQ